MYEKYENHKMEIIILENNDVMTNTSGNHGGSGTVVESVGPVDS